MPQPEERSKPEMRVMFDDHHARQEFEHQLIDRKTTWLLASQALLFAAYGVTYDASGADGTPPVEDFRRWIARSGLAIAP